MSWVLGARRVRGDDSTVLSDDPDQGEAPDGAVSADFDARPDPSPARRVLVVGTDDWAIEQSAAALVEAGFGVLRCHEPGEPEFPCNALIEGRTCPLDVGFDVVATVRARPLDTMAPGELGVVCALRHGVPLVAAGVAPERPFGPWAALTVEQGGELVGACEKVAGEGSADAAGSPVLLQRGGV